jgi:hypothetical protein
MGEQGEKGEDRIGREGKGKERKEFEISLNS